MPAFVPVTINDGQAAPEAVTFSPAGRSGPAKEVAVFTVRDGVPVGDKRLTVSTKHGKRNKTAYRFHLPVVVTSTDAQGVVSPVIVRTGYVRVEFDFADTSTEAERKDAQAFVRNLMASAQDIATKVIVDGEDVW